jgi:hypothetical protein
MVRKSVQRFSGKTMLKNKKRPSGLRFRRFSCIAPPRKTRIQQPTILFSSNKD